MVKMPGNEGWLSSVISNKPPKKVKKTSLIKKVVKSSNTRKKGL